MKKYLNISGDQIFKDLQTNMTLIMVCAERIPLFLYNWILIFSMLALDHRSQAAILMFIPIILGLGFNTRAAWEKKDWRIEEANPTLKNTRVTERWGRQTSISISTSPSFLKLYSWAPGRNTSNKVKLEKKDKSALMQNRDKSLEFRQVYERSREFMGIHKVHSRVCNS